MIWYLKIEIYGNYRELYGIVIGDLWDLKGNFGIIMGDLWDLYRYGPTSSSIFFHEITPITEVKSIMN